VGFDVHVGLFLGETDEYEAIWPRTQREAFLDAINASLRAVGLPEHHEPRGPGATTDASLGASMGSYSSHSRRTDRLDWLARHVAVRGTVPSTAPPYEPELYQAYDVLPDRRIAFDHLLATCGDGTVVLPQPLERLMWGTTPDGPACFVSAQRLQAEATALGYVLGFADPAVSDSPIVDWVTREPVADRSFAGLSARLPDDFDSRQEWAEEALLCHRLLQSADDVLRTGALGLTS